MTTQLITPPGRIITEQAGGMPCDQAGRDGTTLLLCNIRMKTVCHGPLRRPIAPSPAGSFEGSLALEDVLDRLRDTVDDDGRAVGLITLLVNAGPHEHPLP